MTEKLSLSEELQKSLKDIIISCEKEDSEIRKAQIRLWKKYEEFWHGVQFLFWSSRDQTWRSPMSVDWQEMFADDEMEEIGSFYDYVIDIFKAHGESLISALSAKLPGVRFLPDDADSESDTITARTYSKIIDVIQRHNQAKLVFMRALFFMYIGGIVASYRYKDADEIYGTYDIPEYGSETKETSSLVCEECGFSTEEAWAETCPNCGAISSPVQKTVTEEVPFVKSTKKLPKTRIKIEVYGPLFFKIPYYATKQSECGYLIHFLEVSKDSAKFHYPDKHEKIEGEHIVSEDRFSRTEFAFSSNPEIEHSGLVTIIKAWIRPSTFWRENDEHLRDQLFKKFPNGVRVDLCGKGKVFLDAIPEKIEDRWEIGQCGLSTFIHSDPICRPLVPIQEMHNNLANLCEETIEHGIPSDYADPQVLNFDSYGKFEAVPGYVYKAKPVTPTTPLSQSFYQSARATLSSEVFPFFQFLERAGQFALGDFPSVYGGPSEGKSRTFAEYAASRQMALQRLTILWSLITDWWIRTMYGCVRDYVSTIVEDERYVKFEDGSYVNVWIRKSDLTGKVGGVEPEGSEVFPVSVGQKKDVLFKLMEMNNPFINSALYTPDNARHIQDSLSMSEFRLPGEAQRVKQVLEINDLMKGEPIEDGMGGLTSTVQIDSDVDDHKIHIETLKVYLVDQVGLDLKRERPATYMNCIAHMKAHEQALLALTMAATSASPAGVPPPTLQGASEE